MKCQFASFSHEHRHGRPIFCDNNNNNNDRNQSILSQFHSQAFTERINKKKKSINNRVLNRSKSESSGHNRNKKMKNYVPPPLASLAFANSIGQKRSLSKRSIIYGPSSDRNQIFQLNCPNHRR